jgi:hypothetical protein
MHLIPKTFQGILIAMPIKTISRFIDVNNITIISSHRRLHSTQVYGTYIAVGSKTSGKNCDFLSIKTSHAPRTESFPLQLDVL